ncbi:MAG: hypothetical protein IJF87_07695 [Erysipelotrichaceae bacterium]|nr:hypothetical protein [Erysipelotrichaceae bacterium]
MKYFDRKWYLEQCPEAKEYPKGVLKHYIDIGWKEGYDPSRYFSTALYMKERPDILQADLCPLIHYLRHGKREGSKVFASKTVYDGDYRKRPLMSVSRFFSRLLWHRQIRKNKGCRILVVLHLFYHDAFKEIRYYLDNLSCYSYDLIVTYNKDFDYSDVLQTIKRYKNETRFLPVDNKGHDILPFLTALQQTDLEGYDIVYKIHTKCTTNNTGYMYGFFFKNKDWFLNLFDGILGPGNVHRTVDALLKSRETGLCCSRRLIVGDSELKRSMVVERLEEIGIKIDSDYRFVAGTCFAVRREIAESYKAIDIDCLQFTDSSYRGYFSLAHAMERYLGFLVTDQGYRIEGNRISWYQENKWKKLEQRLEPLSGNRLLQECPVTFSREFAARYLDSTFIKDYSFESVRVNDLLTFQADGLQKYRLEESGPYLYLKTGNSEDYIAYCEKQLQTGYLNLSDDAAREKISKECCSRFHELIQEMEEKGYDERKPIVIEKDSKRILDDVEQAAYLLFRYGKEEVVRVLALDPVYFDLYSARPFRSRLKINDLS